MSQKRPPKQRPYRRTGLFLLSWAALAMLVPGVGSPIATQPAARAPQNPTNLGVSTPLCGQNCVIANITVGTTPIRMAYDSGNGDVYVANTGDNTVDAISGTTNTVVATISVGTKPYGVGYDSGNGDVYVTNLGADTVSVVSGTSNTVIKTINVGGEPAAVGYDSANGDLYVPNVSSHSVSVISGATNAVVATIEVGKAPIAAGYDSANGNIYVPNEQSNNVSVISGASNQVVAVFGVWKSPIDAEYDSVNGDIYISESDTNNVTVVSGGTNRVVISVNVGNAPYGVAYDSKNLCLYVANSADNTASVINGSSNTVVATVAVGNTPWGALYDDGNRDVYVANTVTNSLSVINGGNPPPALSSVTVSPTSATLAPGGMVNFTATPVCTGGPCAGPTYAWSLTNSGHGTLSSPSANPVLFTAGSAAGTVTLFVNVTLNGVMKPAPSVPITIQAVVHPLASVTVSPNSANVKAGGTQSFVAAPTCTGGPCPPGATYAWSLTHSLGTLNATTGNPVLFTAKAAGGTVALFVNATLNGVTQPSAPVPIVITTAPINLTSVTVTPSPVTMNTVGTQAFTATPACSGGTCEPGISYSWSLTSSLGTLNSTTGNPVLFSASGTAGRLALFVNATWNGTIRQAPPVLITITAILLSSVAVKPSRATVDANHLQNFTAVPACSGGLCPSNITYAWSLTNSLGTLNASTGNQVTFTAGPGGGLDNLFVNATMGNITKSSLAISVTISGPALCSVLKSVTVSPSMPRLLAEGSQVFTTKLAFDHGSCGPITYAWALNNSLGSLNVSSGPSVAFSAGTLPGDVTLYVNATLNSSTVTGIAHITISGTTSPPSNGSCPTSPSCGSLIWVATGIVVVAGAVIAIILKRKRKPVALPPTPIWPQQASSGNYPSQRPPQPPPQGYGQLQGPPPGAASREVTVVRAGIATPLCPHLSFVP